MQKAHLGTSCHVLQKSVAKSFDNHKVIYDVVRMNEFLFQLQIYPARRSMKVTFGPIGLICANIKIKRN